jgi:hypothetical protein
MQQLLQPIVHLQARRWKFQPIATEEPTAPPEPTEEPTEEPTAPPNLLNHRPEPVILRYANWNLGTEEENNIQRQLVSSHRCLPACYD